MLSMLTRNRQNSLSPTKNLFQPTMSNEKDNVLEILDDVERKVEEFRAAALRLAEDKVELERSVAFVESLTRGMPEMSEVSPILVQEMMSLGIELYRTSMSSNFSFKSCWTTL